MIDDQQRRIEWERLDAACDAGEDRDGWRRECARQHREILDLRAELRGAREAILAERRIRDAALRHCAWGRA